MMMGPEVMKMSYVHLMMCQKRLRLEKRGKQKMDFLIQIWPTKPQKVQSGLQSLIATHPVVNERLKYLWNFCTEQKQ